MAQNCNVRSDATSRLRSKQANGFQWRADFNLTLMLLNRGTLNQGATFRGERSRPPPPLFSLINNCYTALLAPPRQDEFRDCYGPCYYDVVHG